MIVLPPQALAVHAYAPYGSVIAAGADGSAGAPANQGTARRWSSLTALTDLRPGRARPVLSVFRCAPWTASPVPVTLLEKHPGSTQVFIPMNALRFLVVVALGGERPDLATLAAFIATGAQGVSYHPGVWHHPMIALDAETDFASLVWEDGSPGDCTLVSLTPAEHRAVPVPVPIPPDDRGRGDALESSRARPPRDLPRPRCPRL